MYLFSEHPKKSQVGNCTNYSSGQQGFYKQLRLEIAMGLVENSGKNLTVDNRDDAVLSCAFGGTTEMDLRERAPDLQMLENKFNLAILVYSYRIGISVERKSTFSLKSSEPHLLT